MDFSKNSLFIEFLFFQICYLIFSLFIVIHFENCLNQRKLFILDFSDSRESENSKINEHEDLNYKYKAFSVNRFTFPKSPEKYTNYSDYKNNLEEARINLKNAFFSNETFQEKNDE